MAHNNGATNPVTQQDKEMVRVLHAAGMGRNEIARELGRGGRTISIIAAELGLTFDRAAMTEVATRVRKADLEERRVILAEALQGDAERLTEQLWQPTTVFNFGGKDNTYTQKRMPEPPAADKRALATAAATLLDRSMRLVPPAEDSGIEDAESMLGRLMVGLKVAYDKTQAGAAEEEQPAEEAEGESP